MKRTIRVLSTVALVAALGPLAGPALAGEVSRDVDFALDEWIELEVSDGPVTLHRIRLEEIKGGLTKSKLFRPGNDEYLRTVQIEIEYTNTSSRDWEVDIDLRWLDRSGDAIDGYHDEEGLDEDERHEVQTVTLSTLDYGLRRAEKLEIRLSFYPD